MSGFSLRNLKLMVQFYKEYSNDLICATNSCTSRKLKNATISGTI